MIAPGAIICGLVCSRVFFAVVFVQKKGFGSWFGTFVFIFWWLLPLSGICFRVVIKNLARHFIERRFPMFRRIAVDSCSAGLHEASLFCWKLKSRSAERGISEIALYQTYESISGYEWDWVRFGGYSGLAFWGVVLNWTRLRLTLFFNQTPLINCSKIFHSLPGRA